MSAKLYRLIVEYPEENTSYINTLQALIGISFALWRAAFYSDKKPSRKLTHDGLTTLLAEILENNAINYGHEKATNDFTFNYYASNALYRLKELQKRWTGVAKLGPLSPLEPTGEKRWTSLNNAFAKAVDHFETILQANRARAARKHKR